MRKLVLCAVAALIAACGEVVNMPSDDTPDPCANGACKCTVATEATDCGAHEFCNATDTGRTCDCVAGYTNGANGCVWTGTLRDPGLSMSGVWQPVNGALMNPTAIGSVDPGEASFLPSSLCALANVKQTVQMPTFAKSEPLVLALSYKNQIDFNQFDRALMGVSFGGNWSPFQNFTDAMFHNVRICVPEGGYAPRDTVGAGAPVTFALGPFQPPDRCPNSTVTNFAVDHAEIVAANPGECGSVPGQGVNFDSETTGGWTFATSGNSSGGFASGIGVGGSRAARVTLNLRCDSASMTTTINIPATTNPALDMFVGASAGANVSLSFGGGLLSMPAFDAISPAQQTRTLHMCLPPSLRGQTLGLTFFISSGSGSCADVLNHQAFADNVRVVDDPTCDSRDNFTNPGFEQGNAPFGSFGSLGSSTAAAIVRSAAGQAHAGSRYLALESYGRCSSSGYTMMPVVPAPSGGAGPALKFFAKVGANPDASTNVFSRGSPTLTLTEGGNYVPYTFCLNPVFAGRAQTVSISHSGGSGLCDNSNYTQQNAFIDDISVTTDPICPAQ